MTTRILLACCGVFALSSCLADGVHAFPYHFGTPRVDHRPDRRAFTGIPSITVATNGRIWCTWYCGKTPGEDDNSYVVLATSGDGGETWKEFMTVDPDGPGPLRAYDSQVWAAPDGTLRWSWSEKCPRRKGGLFQNPPQSCHPSRRQRGGAACCRKDFRHCARRDAWQADRAQRWSVGHADRRLERRGGK